MHSFRTHGGGGHRPSNMSFAPTPTFRAAAAAAPPSAACVAAMDRATAICQQGGSSLSGRFGGGDELSHGITCLMAQSKADKECGK